MNGDCDFCMDDKEEGQAEQAEREIQRWRESVTEPCQILKLDYTLIRCDAMVSTNQPHKSLLCVSIQPSIYPTICLSTVQGNKRMIQTERRGATRSGWQQQKEPNNVIGVMIVVGCVPLLLVPAPQHVDAYIFTATLLLLGNVPLQVGGHLFR